MIYLAFSLLWIVFTDRLVLALFQTPQDITFVQNIKGFFFVFISSVLIFLLVYIQGRKYSEKEAVFTRTDAQVRSIYMTAPIAIGLEKNRKFVQINHYFCEMTGYSEEEIVGRNTRFLYPSQEEYQRIGIFFKGLSRNPTHEIYETTWVHKNGDLLQVILGLGTLDPNDLTKGVICTARDVTLLKNFGSRLEEEQKRFSKVVKASPMGIHLYKLDKDERLIFQGGNAAADRILGFDQSTIIGKEITEAFPMHETTDIPERYRKAAKHGISWQTEQFDYKDNRINGAFEVYAFQTAPGEMAALFLEITDRIRARDSLREQKDLLEGIMAASPVGIMTVDEKGVMNYANSMAEKILHLDKDKIASKKYVDLPFKLSNCDGSPLPREKYPFHIVKQTLKPLFDSRNAILLEDGTKIFASVNGVPIIDKGGAFRGAVFSIEDITKQKMAEEERAKLEEQLAVSRKLESIAQLAGGVAHDFNNLLTPIIGYTDYLMGQKDSFGDPSVSLIIGDVLEAAKKAKELTQQLLAFGRKQALQVKPVSLNAILEGLKKIIRSSIRENIEVKYFFDKHIELVKADKTQLEQIIMNLLFNSQDAIKNKGSIIIETKNCELTEDYTHDHPDVTPGKYVTLIISDDGAGMDPDTQRRIFEPFYTTKAMGEGTGLGLATVYGIVKQHMGHIWVYSEPDRGTTFKVYLPAYDEAGESDAEPERRRELRAPIEARVLVVEDDEKIRNMLGRVLKKAGFELFVAESEADAIAIAGKNRGKIDLLLTDVIMPAMNGVELYQEIRKNEPDIRVLYMSGYTDNVIAHNGILDPEVNFIQKPFSLSDLYDKIISILKSNPKE